MERLRVYVLGPNTKHYLNYNNALFGTSIYYVGYMITKRKHYDNARVYLQTHKYRRMAPIVTMPR